MVQINPPPPDRLVKPVYFDIPQGLRLVRIFDPTRRGARALTFRWNGPLKRFDHHLGKGPNYEPCESEDRAVYYCSWSEAANEAFSSCFVEVFGDTGIVIYGDREVAMPELMRPLRLLDLRGRGAMRSGTVSAVAKCQHRLSQPWSRHFYEATPEFEVIDGLYYLNAHNDQPAILLYERAAGGLTCSQDYIVRLDDHRLQGLIHCIMDDHNLYYG